MGTPGSSAMSPFGDGMSGDGMSAGFTPGGFDDGMSNLNLIVSLPEVVLPTMG
jgi:hypothetical protein